MKTKIEGVIIGERYVKVQEKKENGEKREE